MYSFSITKKYDKKDRVIAKINGGDNDGEFIKLEENDRKIKYADYLYDSFPDFYLEHMSKN
jgi:hypothetical protein